MKRFTTALCTLLILTSTAWAETGMNSVDTEVKTSTSDRIPARSEASAKQMRGIWYSLKVSATEAGRVAVIEYAAKRYFFSPIQAEALIEVVQNHGLRAQLISRMAPRLTDANGMNRLFKMMPDGPARDAVRNALLPTLAAAS